MNVFNLVLGAEEVRNFWDNERRFDRLFSLKHCYERIVSIFGDHLQVLRDSYHGNVSLDVPKGGSNGVVRELNFTSMNNLNQPVQLEVFMFSVPLIPEVGSKWSDLMSVIQFTSIMIVPNHISCSFPGVSQGFLW